ncbi:MAG: hypothetical protein R3B99_35850, partial [Polyangiales bacterium]
LARLPLWPLDDGVDAVRWWPLRKLLAESRGAERTVRLRVPTSYRARRRFPRAAFRVEGTDLVALRRLLPNLELVEYEPGRGEEILPARLAARFAMSSEVVALVDREDQHRRGVVVLTQREPELVIHHRGQRVERRPFQPTLLPCRIGVDDDLVVPNPVYTATILDSPHPLRTEEWERALLDALIDGLGGGDSALFDARGLETLDWIRDALIVGLERRRLEALDEARRAKIEAYPLVSRAYGERLSLHELREEKGPLVWVLADVRVDRDLDWNPILANEDTARAIGRLVARRVVDGRSELDRRRRDVDRLRRETAIRRGSTPPPPEAGAGSVALTGTIAGAAAYGVLRFAPSRFVQGLRVDLRIEGHAYRMHDLPSAVPLEAAIDLPMDALGAERSGLLPSVEAEIAGACQRALGPLLVEVGSQAPSRLLEDPLVARALETYVASGIRKGSKVAAKLCAIPAFRTVQGELASIEEASTHSRVRVAQHSGGWLGPVDDDDRHTLDKPVLLVGDGGGLRGLIEKLAAPKGLLDHTRAVRTLQAERRVRQGVVSAPTLTEVAVGLKAAVRELSPRKRIPAPLGPGEIGLVERGPAQAGVFSNGMFVAWLPLSVSPPIRAVMEVPALVEDAQRMPASTGSRLSEPLTSLTSRLIREHVLPHLDEHPAWVRHSVRRAFAAKVLDAKDLEGAAIFETTSDRWLGTRELYEQANTYGEVWYTSRTSVRDRARLPLDEARLVLRLDADEVGNLSQRVTLYDAAERLEREDRARQNLAKPRVTELFLHSRAPASDRGDQVRSWQTPRRRGSAGRAFRPRRHSPLPRRGLARHHHHGLRLADRRPRRERQAHAERDLGRRGRRQRRGRDSKLGREGGRGVARRARRMRARRAPHGRDRSPAFERARGTGRGAGQGGSSPRARAGPSHPSRQRPHRAPRSGHSARPRWPAAHDSDRRRGARVHASDRGAQLPHQRGAAHALRRADLRAGARSS